MDFPLIDATNATAETTDYRVRTLDCAVCLAAASDGGFATPADTVYDGAALCVVHFRERLQD